MLNKSPRVIDYMALSLRFIAKILALTVLYSISTKAGIEIIAMLVLMLGEVYHVAALAISVLYPYRRPFVYAIVGGLDSILLVLGLWYIGSIASDAYLVVMLILIPLILSGGLLPSIVIAITTSTTYAYFLFLIGEDPLFVLLRIMIIAGVSLLVGLLAHVYHRNQQLLSEEKEKSFIRAQADMIREKFTIITSHNLRAPLLSTRSYLDLLSEGSITVMATDNTIEKIIEQVSRLEYLIEQLLRLSAINAVIPRDDRMEADLVEVLSAIISSYAPRLEKTHKRLVFDHTQKHVKLLLHERLFREAISNIIDNAVRVVGDLGMITVTLTQGEFETIITISDNGPGIPKEELPAIFTHFRHVSSQLQENEGLGIGLYIARSIIEAHEGTIRVTSVLGEGTTFVVAIPISATRLEKA